MERRAVRRWDRAAGVVELSTVEFCIGAVVELGFFVILDVVIVGCVVGCKEVHIWRSASERREGSSSFSCCLSSIGGSGSGSIGGGCSSDSSASFSVRNLFQN